MKCPICKGEFNNTKELDDLKERLATLQKDNDTLNTDLTEAEGAVSDLMELNDTLTAEVKYLKKADERAHKLIHFYEARAEEAENLLNHKEK